MEPKITQICDLTLRRFSASLVSLLFWATLATAEDFTGKVVGVHDGDTITVMHQGRGERVRLHGTDEPERGQPFSNRAKQFVSDLCYHKKVKVETKGITSLGGFQFEPSQEPKAVRAELRRGNRDVRS